MWIKIDAESGWKWIPVRVKMNRLNFYHLWSGVCDGLVTCSAHCKGSIPPASACSESICATSGNSFFLTGMGFFFFFSSNYLDDPCPNLVYLAAETDLDESQHLVPLSSLSQSPSPMGWKVVVTNTHWICSFLQMLRGISHDIMDFDYNHRNAGITRTRPDHKAACSSFPSPNAL